MSNFKDKLSTLPETFGCYLMKNIKGEVIYVGKAINLRKRVNQYFVGAHNFKTTKLVSEIADFDTIIAESEKEALILEYNLIKKYDPKFNIIFKDDKSYPYILVSNEEIFVVKTIRLKNKHRIKGKIFGPYPNALAANKTVDLINKIFPIRKCRHLLKEVCIYYHLKQCKGYCVYDLGKDYLNNLRNDIISFLNGDVDRVIKDLIEKRNTSSNELNFEYAKECQELIESINYVTDKQSVQINKYDNLDLFNYYLEDQYLVCCILNVRAGKLLNRLIVMNQLYSEVEDEIISYLIQYYESNIIPDEVIVYDEKIADNLNQYFDTETFRVAKRGRKKSLLEKTYKNAFEYYHQSKKMIIKKDDYYVRIKKAFRNILGFDANEIEIYDNSHLHGEMTVAGKVTYRNFKPYKKGYRRYRLNDSFDDLKSMYEVLYRRFYRGIINDEKMPDLLIVDGGKTQINVAKNVLKELDLDIVIMGLGKDDKHNTAYLMDGNFDVVDLSNHHELFMFLSNMQDEVHRYTIEYNKLLRKKALEHRILEDIEGIGRATSAKLMKHFTYLSRIEKAEIEELSAVIPFKIAENVYNYFRGHNVRNGK